MNKILFSFSFLSLLLLFTPLGAQNFTCDQITISGPASVDVGSTYQYTVSSSNPLVSAYYWEIPNGMDIVSGQYSSTITVFVVSQVAPAIDICVKAYTECSFIECCKTVKIKTCPPPPGPCCTAEDFEILYTIQYECFPPPSPGSLYYKMELLNDCDLTIDHIDWTLSHGYWISNGLPTITVIGGGAPGWYWPDNCGFPFTTTAVIYFKNGCDEVKVTKNNYIPCCEEENFRSKPQEEFQQAPINIHPNPTENLINISGLDLGKTQATLTIYSLQGQVVKSEKLHQTQLNLSDLLKGAYILSITDPANKILHQQKIMLQ